MTPQDNTSRFGGRVQNYIKFRPTYPPGLMDLLVEKCALTPASVIADIGSGTGILAEMFLRQGNPVFAVEPHAEMRNAAEQLLGSYPNFRSIDGSAEATTIASQSVNLVTAGQAFHWFEQNAARAEFIRILKPGGWVALIWNRARTDTPFLREYDHFWRNDLRTAHEAMDDYHSLAHRFFGEHEHVTLEGIRRDMSRDDLVGRILSISASIQPGEAGHEAFMERVHAMFERHQQNGTVTMKYNTDVFWGQIH